MDQPARHSSSAKLAALPSAYLSPPSFLDFPSRSFSFALPSLCTFLLAPSRFGLLGKNFAACYELEEAPSKGQQHASAGQLRPKSLSTPGSPTAKRVDDLRIEVLKCEQSTGTVSLAFPVLRWSCGSWHWVGPVGLGVLGSRGPTDVVATLYIINIFPSFEILL